MYDLAFWQGFRERAIQNKFNEYIVSFVPGKRIMGQSVYTS